MNQQDPLAQLRDIHLPDAIGFWPPAPGWWLLAALLLAAAAAAIFVAARRFYANAYRRRALSELDGICRSFAQHQDCQVYLGAITQLLRRTAIRAFPRSAAATLQGRAWLQFLDATAPTANFLNGPGQSLITLPYQSREVLQREAGATYSALRQCVAEWIERHRPERGPVAPVELHHVAS